MSDLRQLLHDADGARWTNPTSTRSVSADGGSHAVGRATSGPATTAAIEDLDHARYVDPAIVDAGRIPDPDYEVELVTADHTVVARLDHYLEPFEAGDGAPPSRWVHEGQPLAYDRSGPMIEEDAGTEIPSDEEQPGR